MIPLRTSPQWNPVDLEQVKARAKWEAYQVAVEIIQYHSRRERTAGAAMEHAIAEISRHRDSLRDDE